MKSLLMATTLFLILLGFVSPFSTLKSKASSTDVELPHLDQSQYIGSQKCEACHKSYFDSWKVSAHNKMIRPAIFEGPDRTVVADFSKPSEFRPFEMKDVKWVIGHRWKQRFIGVVNGEEVVFPAQWSIKDKKWQAYGGKADWWYPQHPDWKTRSNFKLCAGCHSTGLDVQTQQWRELNISCESCHGAGRKHSENSRIEDIVNPARLTRDRSMDVCLSCHQSGRPHGAQTEYGWPVGYQPGEILSKYWKGFEPEGKLTPEFWPNGTAKKNRVQGNTFVQSAMHDRKLQCSNCHDSHSGRHPAMTLKSASDNALCLTCHSPGQKQKLKEPTLSEHTHHAATSTGSRCIECHMAKTGDNSVAAESRNHTFDFISPAATIKNGNPNSCNLCHKDKTVAWSLEFVQKWYPK